MNVQGFVDAYGIDFEILLPLGRIQGAFSNLGYIEMVRIATLQRFSSY